MSLPSLSADTMTFGKNSTDCFIKKQKNRVYDICHSQLGVLCCKNRCVFAKQHPYANTGLLSISGSSKRSCIEKILLHGGLHWGFMNPIMVTLLLWKTMVHCCMSDGLDAHGDCVHWDIIRGNQQGLSSMRRWRNVELTY